MPAGGITKFVKLLPGCPFRLVVNGVPSCLNRSTRTVAGIAVVLEMTISDDQPPPAANCGNITELPPPTPALTCGTGVDCVGLTIGMVLNTGPRKRNPTIATGEVEGTARVPSKSMGMA